MKVKKKISLLLILISLFVMPINNATSQTQVQSKKTAGITLQVITRHASDIFKPFRDAFLASNLAKDAGVTGVEFWSKSPGEWVTEAQKGFYDVGWGGGPTLFDQLNDLNLLPEITDPGVLNEASSIADSISGVPLKRYNTTCTTGCTNPTWIAAAISSFGFTVNHDVLDANGLAVPRTWADLANVSYFSSTKPLVAIGNAPDTTSNTRVYEIILQALGWNEGWALISAIAGNSVIYHGSTEVLNAVILGEVAIALTIDFYGYEAQKSNPSTEYIIPQGQSIVNGDPISLLNGPSGNRVGANAFVQFVLSKEGQAIWMKDTINRLPVREDVFSTPAGQQRPDLKDAYDIAKNNVGIDFNDSKALSYSQITLSYFQTALTDIQDDLQTGWGKIVNAYRQGDIPENKLSDWIYSFGYPVISEQDAISLDSQAYDTTLQGQWRSAMSSQYLSVGSEADKSSPVAPKTSPVNYFPPPTTTTPTNTTTPTQPTSSSKGQLISPGFEGFFILALIPIVVLMRKKKIN